MKGALLVAGTTSDAGKSVLTAGLCRWLVRQGVRVAPFKAQNMALNSAVTADGAEIGRAQAMQAAAARVEPEAVMNPVLLKPGSDTRSQVVLLGRPIGEVGAMDYRRVKPRLARVVQDSLAQLRERFDVVICEGAGSPAEINLRDRDITNMGLARAAALPVLVVGDIDRGGIFASLFGTLAVLEPADQRLIAGFVVNKFRGDLRLLVPGLESLQQLTGRPTLGVLPWQRDLWLDAEDSLDLDSRPHATLPPLGAETLRIAVVRLPRMSNVTDVDPLAAEPGVAVTLAAEPAHIGDADLVILPGTRATISDLRWLRTTGLAEAIVARAAAGRPVLGICGGYQMLTQRIQDTVESGRGEVAGLGLLPAHVRFLKKKTVGRPCGQALGEAVSGYEIHHGVVTVTGGQEFLGGCAQHAVWGTSWHGIFESDGFRRAFLRTIAVRAGRRFSGAPNISFADVRERRLELIGDLVAAHLDTVAISRIIDLGAAPGLPIVRSRLRSEAAPATSTPPDLSHHGDADLVPGLVDLAVNVRPGGTPGWLKARISAADFDAYPDQQRALDAVAQRHGRHPGEVLLTAGAAEAFVLIARALQPRHAVVVHPQFTEPEAALHAAGHAVDRVVLPFPFTLDPELVPVDADLVFVGNPTNPTSVVHPRAAIRALVRPGRLVVVDEAFADCVPGERESFAAGEDLSGLVVVRSLTKTWALAGLRVGYVLAAPVTVRRLASAQPLWPVSTLALEACVAASSARALEEIESWVQQLTREREYLLDRLGGCAGLTVTPRPAASFVLLDSGLPDVRSRLRSKGFAVRRGETFPGLDSGWIRAAVRDSHTTDAFAVALREVLGDTPPWS